MADLIKFNKGLQAGYDVLTPVSTEIYITTDTGKIYLGTKLLGDYDSQAIKDVTISSVVNGVATFTFTKEDNSTFTRTLTLPTVKPYVGENAIVVDDSDVDENVISLSIKTGDKVLSQDTNGLFSTISIVKEGTPPDGLASQYKLVGIDGTTALGVTIDIAKDQLIGDVEYVHNATQTDVDTADDRGVTIELGKSYIAIEFLLGTTTVKWTYVDVTDLVDIYTAGNGLQLSGNEFSVKLDATSEKDSNNVSYLSVGADGIKLSGINAELAKKVDKVIVGTNGTSTMFNEGDGGGAMFVNPTENITSFTGVNDSANGIGAETYVKDSTTNVGTRIINTVDKVYYTTGNSSSTFTNDDEIATIGDLPSEFNLTAAANQPISVGGKTSAVTTVINSTAVSSTGGLQVTSGALETKIDTTTGDGATQGNVTLSTSANGLSASLFWGTF